MKKKKTKIAIIGVIALVLVTIGITYAYWLITRTQEGENVITTGCLDIALSGENDITLSNQFPISDEDGMKLTPYTFTVTNNCDSEVDYQIALESTGTESTSISASALKVALDDEMALLSTKAEIDTTISGAYAANKLGIRTLAAKGSEGASVTHTLRIWLDENAPVSEMSTAEITKTFKGKITVTSGQGIENVEGPYNEGTLAYSIIKNSGGTTTGDTGLLTLTDDYGESYYFTGNVTNNYVKMGIWQEDVYRYYPADYESHPYLFVYDTYEECMNVAEASSQFTECTTTGAKSGDPMYWRILRINGDGTIRLIYDGTAINTTDLASKSIAGANGVVYNNNTTDQTATMGYTFAVEGTQKSSTVKNAIDEWYVTNLETTYSSYLADRIFCNDRSSTNGVFNATDRTPILTCSQSEDRYTVSPDNGNGYLTNPIGLITYDEAKLANKFLDGNRFTMTPYYGSSGSMGYIYHTLSGGMPADQTLTPDSTLTLVSPVINLKADVEFTGNGTIDSPYEIVMN